MFSMHCFRIVKAKLVSLCEHREEKLSSAQAKVQGLTKQLDAEIKKVQSRTEASDKYQRVSRTPHCFTKKIHKAFKTFRTLNYVMCFLYMPFFFLYISVFYLSAICEL